MENKNLSSKKSLEIITNMIETAKGNYFDNGFYFRLWGWIVLIASLGHYSLLKFTSYPHPYVVWLLIIIGVIISIIYGIKSEKKVEVKTHIDGIVKMLWIGFFISYCILLGAMQTVNYSVSPFILLLAGNAVFINGIIIKFKTLTISGIMIWLTAGFSFYVSNENQLLLSALAVLFYLIPGYLLKANSKKENV